MSRVNRLQAITGYWEEVYKAYEKEYLKGISISLDALHHAYEKMDYHQLLLKGAQDNGENSAAIGR